MDSKSFFKEQKKLMTIQRFLYFILAFYVMLLYGMKVEGSLVRTTVYISVIFVMALIDELFIYFNFFDRMSVLSIWRFIQYLLVMVSLYGAFDYPYTTVMLLGFLVLYMIEFIISGDIFDAYSNISRIVILFVPVFIFVIVMASKNRDSRWIYILFSLTVLYIIIIRIMLFAAHILKMYKEELHIKNTVLNEAEDANQKLMEYQERIKTVNTALNLQKLDLEKANDMIQMANDEIRVQAEISRFISGSFDVVNIVGKIIDSIVTSKHVSFCAVYIDKNVYLNKQANCIVWAEDSAIKRKLNRDLPDIYGNYSTGYADTIIENNVNSERYPFVKDATVLSMIMLPLKLNNETYGILIVGNSKAQFTEDNLSFYETIISQMNVAVNNCKLYLQTEDMARKDGLTGINNRTYFTTLYNETVRKTMAIKSTICVALFDIDKFKLVNDTYGHLAGDEVIKTVASVTRDHIEAYNGFVCRYGGEEFVAVLPGKNVSTAKTIIDELHSIIANSVVEYGGDRIGMNVSIGLTAYPEICDNPYDLLKRADWAMYYAKEHGRGQVKVDGDDVKPVS